MNRVIHEDNLQKVASRLIDLDLTLRAMVPLIEEKARQIRRWNELAGLPDEFLGRFNNDSANT